MKCIWKCISLTFVCGVIFDTASYILSAAVSSSYMSGLYVAYQIVEYAVHIKKLLGIGCYKKADTEVKGWSHPCDQIRLNMSARAANNKKNDINLHEM